MRYRRYVVLVRGSRLAGHEVCGAAFEHDFVSGGALDGGRCRRGGRTVRAEPHAAFREQGNARDDVVLRGVTVPADWRARRIFVDESHRKRVVFDLRPYGNPLTQRKQKVREWLGLSPVVASTEECDTPSGHDASHLERRECDLGDSIEERAFLRLDDEALAVMKTTGTVLPE